MKPLQLTVPESLAYWLRRLEQVNPRVAAVIRRTLAKRKAGGRLAQPERAGAREGE